MSNPSLLVLSRRDGQAYGDVWASPAELDEIISYWEAAGFDIDVAWPLQDLTVDELRDYALTLPDVRRTDGDTLVARQLERLDIPFFGSAAGGLAAEDKGAMKRALVKAGLATLPWLELDVQQISDMGAVEQALHKDGLSPPWVAKPRRGNSSTGVSKASNLAQLQASVRRASASGDGRVIVEPYVRAHEYTVAVLGNGERRRAFAMELLNSTPDEIIDVAAKQLGPSLRLLNPHTAAALEELVLASCAALQILDFARVDVVEDGRGNHSIIDVNTYPGLGSREGRVGPFTACVIARAEASRREVLCALLGVALAREERHVSRQAFVAGRQCGVL